MAITWKIDPAHTEIQFKVRHLMITTVTGYFRKFDGYVITEMDDFNSVTEIHFNADVNSIDTNNEQRDTHLKSNEFFDAEKHNQVIFTGTRFESLGSEATLQGNLSIRGVTKPISLNVDYGGTVIDPYGQTKAGFTVTGKISRKEFGLTWNAVTEAGQVVASDEIRLHAEVQFIRQA
jgi:polyisoprenoid-binding protein YceI